MRPLALFAGIVMLAGPASLAVMAAPPARSLPAAAPKPAATPKPKPPKPHTVSGTLESYDASAKTLTVKGSKATWTFNVADARVWDGSKSVGLEDIVSRTGAKVMIPATTVPKFSAGSALKSAVKGG